MNIATIYKFHPDFKNEEFEIWYGEDVDRDHGNARIEGGDVMPIGNKTVLIGMGERTTRQTNGQLASNCRQRTAFLTCVQQFTLYMIC